MAGGAQVLFESPGGGSDADAPESRLPGVTAAPWHGDRVRIGGLRIRKEQARSWECALPRPGPWVPRWRTAKRLYLGETTGDSGFAREEIACSSARGRLAYGCSCRGAGGNGGRMLGRRHGAQRHRGQGGGTRSE